MVFRGVNYLKLAVDFFRKNTSLSSFGLYVLKMMPKGIFLCINLFSLVFTWGDLVLCHIFAEPKTGKSLAVNVAIKCSPKVRLTNQIVGLFDQQCPQI